MDDTAIRDALSPLPAIPSTPHWPPSSAAASPNQERPDQPSERPYALDSEHPLESSAAGWEVEVEGASLGEVYATREGPGVLRIKGAWSCGPVPADATERLLRAAARECRRLGCLKLIVDAPIERRGVEALLRGAGLSLWRTRLGACGPTLECYVNLYHADPRSRRRHRADRGRRPISEPQE